MILHQVAQGAEDLDRAAAFYADLLGQEPVARYDPPGLVFFDLAGTRLMIEVGSPGSLLYLRVDDVRARLEELRVAGVAIEGEAHEVFGDPAGTFGPPGGSEWIAFIRDSEGNLVGLATRYPAED
ncbi:MAG TPA: VOC family protein [Iamia sp.]|nr:VOC family protein [Iamia sp.]